LKARLSTEPGERGERVRLLDAITRNGLMTDYCGVRITKSGSRFRVEDGIVWQLKDRRVGHGQAGMFSKWVET
jgi:hypothetical protein